MSYFFSVTSSSQGPALQSDSKASVVLWGSRQANSTAEWIQALRCVSFPVPIAPASTAG